MNPLSSSSLSEDEREFNSIRPTSSALSYGRFGDFTQDQVDRLGRKWFPDDPENQGVLQSIWTNHPKRQQGKYLFK